MIDTARVSPYLSGHVARAAPAAEERLHRALPALCRRAPADRTGVDSRDKARWLSADDAARFRVGRDPAADQERSPLGVPLPAHRRGGEQAASTKLGTRAHIGSVSDPF